jgi:hypothetical protein
MCDLWRTKWHWGRFSPSTSVSLANFHSTKCTTITFIYNLGLVQQANKGHSAEWTQSHPTKNNKKYHAVHTFLNSQFETAISQAYELQWQQLMSWAYVQTTNRWICFHQDDCRCGIPWGANIFPSSILRSSPTVRHYITNSSPAPRAVFNRYFRKT